MTTEPGTACRHERAHITDSRFYGDRYGTPASRAIFCDVCRHQRWLDIESALALSQAELGIIPVQAAEDIAASARIQLIDVGAVQAEIERSGHSLVGLLRVFRAACPGGSGQYIHFGATTQDIQDTGQTLEMRDVLDELATGIDVIIARLADLAEQHAGTVFLGRTHAQPAVPISFGVKVSSWLDELLRHGERIRAMRPRVLVAQLFGAAGTMAGFGDRGPELLRRFADRLGLAAPAIGWHVARDRVAEYCGVVAMVAGSLGRIADEIRTLSRPEFGEVEESWRPGKVGSSTMPHKRNPEGCEQVVVMARLASQSAATALTAMIGDHERDARSLRLEWVCVPDVSSYTLCAAQIVKDVLAGLVVHADRALVNVTRVADQIASERLMFVLAESLGKERAHEYVYELTQRARSNGRSVRGLLASASDLGIDSATLDAVFDPATYLGASATLTGSVVSDARRYLTGKS